MKTRIYTWQPVEVREAADDGPTTIAGVAAVFYDGTPRTEYKMYDDMIERIEPGAFDKTIREDDIYGLLNHNDDKILGRNKSETLELSVDTEGLRYVITPGDTTVARDAIEWIGRKEITGSSFAFRVRTGGQRWEEEEDGTYIRTLTDLVLFDVSPVTRPAYKASTVSVRESRAQAIREFIESRKQASAELRAVDETRVRAAIAGAL